MFENLTVFLERNQEITEKLYDPAVVSDPAQYAALMKEQKQITPLVEAYTAYQKAEQAVADALEMLQEPNLDKDMKELLDEELATAKADVERLTEELKILLLPRDPNDDRNVILEIRGGAGGEEAALFSAVLFRMYSMYAESQGWKVEVLSSNETELGGYKEISVMITGDGAYSKLKYESGVHRVQRVPETETQGRVHTSTATVAVLPEAEDVEIEINPADLQIDTYRASGAGGQHVNKTESAIRITHLPTGLIVECQDERSQFKNKDKAMKILRSRLYELEQSKQDAEFAEKRRSQVGTGDRSERIRTYNYPQGRVTDHRIGLTLYKFEDILNGNLTELIDALITADRTAMLEQAVEEPAMGEKA